LLFSMRIHDRDSHKGQPGYHSGGPGRPREYCGTELWCSLSPNVQHQSESVKPSYLCEELASDLLKDVLDRVVNEMT
jgi:hypothetical protein